MLVFVHTSDGLLTHVSMMPFKSSLVDLSGDDMVMTSMWMLVVVHASDGILAIVCFNDAFQIFARAFIRRGHGYDNTPNASS